MVGADLGRAVLVALIPIARLDRAGRRMPALYRVGVRGGGADRRLPGRRLRAAAIVVEPAQIVDANGRLSATQSASEIGGRGLGGLLVQALSAPVAVAAQRGGLPALGPVPAADPAAGHRAATTADARRGPRAARPGATRSRGSARAAHRNIRPLLGEATTFNLANEVFLLGLLLYAVREANCGRP